MISVFRRVFVLLVLVALATSAAAQAQEPTQSPRDGASPVSSSSVSSPRRLTGKERLGEKWNDEQRLDNCNVPVDKRGPKPRPDACENAAPQ
jgi:hypothetical protein